ncbi:unnamed protein product [Camellia sinensis]
MSVTFKGHLDCISGLTVGGGFLFSSSFDKTVHVWSLQDYSLPYTMNGHKSVVSTLAVCNGVLYSGSWDGTVRLWCLSDHSPLTVLGEDVPGNVTFVLSLGTYGDALVVAHENGCMKNFFLVVRGGRRENISIYDIVVGDVIPLKIGDQVTGVGINTEWGLLMLCSSNNQLYSPSQALVRTHMVWKKDKKRIRRVRELEAMEDEDNNSSETGVPLLVMLRLEAVRLIQNL